MTKVVNEPSAINMVTKFQELTGNNIEDSPTIPIYERCSLRISLIQEELNELQIAMDEMNIVEAADALCDIQYVVSGPIIELGLAECFAELFAEVHRSNMSKACKNMEEVRDTMEWYEDRGIKNTNYMEVGDGLYFVIDLDNNNKTLKSKYYSPANLKPIIDKYL